MRINPFLKSSLTVAATMTRLQAALQALREGKIVCLYDADGREEETDMVVASQHASPATIRRMRADAGGLLCTTVAPEHHRKLGLPFASDLVAGMAAKYPVLAGMKANDLRYDPSRSSFGITLNSRRTFTGVTDLDRSLTIQELASFLGALDGLEADRAQASFGERFRTPGHVILLNGAAGGLAERQGHTELSIQLARMAGTVPSTTLCEMLGEGGLALGRKAAQEYARRHGMVFLTGQEILEACQLPAAPNARATPATPPSAMAQA